MTPTRTTRALVRLALAVPLVALHACGDDDGGDDATATTEAAATPTTEAAAPPTTASTTDPPATTATPTTAAADDDLAAYCAIATEIFEQDGPPTLEQVQAYAEAAPAEIAEPTGIVVTAIEEAGGDITAVFSSPEAGAAFEEMTAFEAEACGLGEPLDEEATTVDPDATRIDVTATDYHFDAALPTAAGRYSFVMANEGEAPHLMVLLRLEEGAELAEVMASEGETGVAEMYESVLATPGGNGVITADLAPGHWILLCPIPDDDGTSHVELGMIHEFDIA